jgi:TatD DNase family protein
MTLIDSHCHLDEKQFDADREAVIDRALAAGVEQMLVIGTGDGPPDYEAGIRLADKYACIVASVGVHPHSASQADDKTSLRLSELLKHPKVVALGEIGLDYHYDFTPRDVQQRVFIDQMHVAREARKPIVIHTREAWPDTLQLIEEHWAPSGLPGIMHCFSGGPEEAAHCLGLGFYISFAGVVTFPKALNVQEAAKMVPADRLLIETDAPYLAPAPNRGKRNEPAFVVHTAAKIAALRGQTIEDIAVLSSTNFRSLCYTE